MLDVLRGLAKNRVDRSVVENVTVRVNSSVLVRVVDRLEVLDVVVVRRLD